MRRADETRVAVTVADMARMVGLSRARFYELIRAGVFPAPERQAETGRPFYGKGLQRTCLEVRRRNCGVNGKPVLFYARRLPSSTPRAGSRKIKTAAAKIEPSAALVDAVKGLGLKAVTPAQVAAAVAQVYPKGVESLDEGEVIVAVFSHLMERAKG